MKGTGISIDQLDKETLKKLGMDGIDSQVLALSHVLDSLRNAQKDDAIWALKKALSMLEPKLEAPDYADMVLKAVSERFDVLIDDLKSKGRTPNVVLARQVVMYILWRSEDFTLEQIGSILNGRTPATVSWGVAQVQKLLPVRPKVASVVNGLLTER